MAAGSDGLAEYDGLLGKSLDGARASSCYSAVEHAQPVADEVEPLKWTAVVSTCFACLSGLLLGYDVGIINGALLPVSEHFQLSNVQQSLFVGISDWASLFGCVMGSYVADVWGRRPGIGLGAIFFLVGNSLMTFAVDYNMLVVGRGICGLAVGMTLVIEPLYTAEVSPARVRGMLSTNVEVSYNVGILCGFIVSWCLCELPSHTSWRTMFGLCLPAPVISLFGVTFVIPESPRWLAASGQLPDAQQVLERLLGPVEAQSAFAALRKKLSDTGNHEDRAWSAICATPDTRWLAMVGMGVAFFSQATGLQGIQYYSSVILEGTGAGRQSVLGIMVVIGMLNLFAIIVQGVFVDNVGRKPLLVVSSLGMCVSNAALGTAFLSSSSSVWLKAAPMACFMVFFELGFGPIVYTLNAELYPKNIRSKGLTLALGMGRVIAALVSTTFLSLTRLLTVGGTFCFFALWAVAAAVFVMAFVPETRGTSLETKTAS